MVGSEVLGQRGFVQPGGGGVGVDPLRPVPRQYLPVLRVADGHVAEVDEGGCAADGGAGFGVVALGGEVAVDVGTVVGVDDGGVVRVELPHVLDGGEAFYHLALCLGVGVAEGGGQLVEGGKDVDVLRGLRHLFLQLLGIALDDGVADADALLGGEVQVFLHHEDAGGQRGAAVGVGDGLPQGEVGAVRVERVRVAVHLVAVVVRRAPVNLRLRRLGQLLTGGGGVFGGHLDVIQDDLVAVLRDDVGQSGQGDAFALVEHDFIVPGMDLEGCGIVRVAVVVVLGVVGQLEVPPAQLPGLEVRGEVLLRDDGGGVEVEPGYPEVPDGVLLVDGVALIVRAALDFVAGIAVQPVLQPRPHVAYGQLGRRVDVVEVEGGGEYLARL